MVNATSKRTRAEVVVVPDNILQQKGPATEALERSFVKRRRLVSNHDDDDGRESESAHHKSDTSSSISMMFSTDALFDSLSSSSETSFPVIEWNFEDISLERNYADTDRLPEAFVCTAG